MTNISSTSFSPLSKIVVTVAILNALWLFIHAIGLFVYMDNAFDSGFYPQLDVEVMRRLIRITLCLILASVGLCANRKISLCFSCVVFSLITYEYFNWFYISQNMLKNAGILSFPPIMPHTFNLVGATIWNGFILVFSLIALGWNVGSLASILRNDSTKVEVNQ